MSTTKAKYMEIVMVVKNNLWITILIRKLGVEQDEA